MNLLLQLLTACALIAVMIVVRMISDRRVLEHRLSCGHRKGPGCSHGCSKKKADAQTSTGLTEI